MILLIDNYDSFTYNLYQCLATLDVVITVKRNDQITLDEIADLPLSGIVLSPGPGHPTNTGISLSLIQQYSGKVPILGVCLGHQAIGLAFGGKITLAPEQMHGKTSMIIHGREGIYSNLPCPFTAGRYHSLIIDRDTLPDELIIEAETIEGIIMGIKHRDHPTYGIQFHPESILTPAGKLLLNEFVQLTQEKKYVN